MTFVGDAFESSESMKFAWSIHEVTYVNFTCKEKLARPKVFTCIAREHLTLNNLTLRKVFTYRRTLKIMIINRPIDPGWFFRALNTSLDCLINKISKECPIEKISSGINQLTRKFRIEILKYPNIIHVTDHDSIWQAIYPNLKYEKWQRLLPLHFNHGTRC